MKKIFIREPQLTDEPAFLQAMQDSEKLHSPWIIAPTDSKAFHKYIERSSQENQKNYLTFTEDNVIIGVFNISEIVRGFFQSAYLGFYGVR